MFRTRDFVLLLLMIVACVSTARAQGTSDRKDWTVEIEMIVEVGDGN